MCVLIYAEKRKVNENEFKNCFKDNSDGFGMAWRSNNKVYFKKGLMEVEEAWKFYNESVVDNGHILHFRKKSTGTISDKLTHPFIISKESPLLLDGEIVEDKTTKGLLFQNGTLTDWEDYKMTYLISSGEEVTDELSDTRMMAIIIAKTGRHILNHLPGKFIVYNKECTYIFGDYEEVDGVWFSNSSYKDRVVSIAKSTVLASFDDGYDEYLLPAVKNHVNKEKTEKCPWDSIANYTL